MGPVTAGEWSGSAELGYLASSGNSDTKNLNAGFKLEYEINQWQHGLEAKGAWSEDEGETTAERYSAETNSHYNYSSRSFWFVDLSYERDKFAGVQQRTSQSLGFGRKLLNTPKYKLEVQLGPGATQLKFQDGTRESSIIGVAKSEFDWKIGENANFGQDFRVEHGSDNTYAESVTELKLNIIRSVFAKLSYTVKHSTDVPPDQEETDTYTAVSIVYEFGNGD